MQSYRKQNEKIVEMIEIYLLKVKPQMIYYSMDCDILKSTLAIHNDVCMSKSSMIFELNQYKSPSSQS